MMFQDNKIFVRILLQQLITIATCIIKCEIKTHFKKEDFLNLFTDKSRTWQRDWDLINWGSKKNILKTNYIDAKKVDTHCL